ncbi:MAG: hypothetical protein COA79_22610 [Planctomycetota bacterium]|nr:MAG: hypothetical protein COA79_22610 [Planctomycetota bacterium]
MINQILPILSIPAGIGVILWLSSLSRFQAHIKKFDVDTFNHLGEPNMFSNNNATNLFKLINYLVKKEYQKSQNNLTRKKAGFLRVLFNFLAIVFLLCTILNIYLLFGPKPS